MSICGQRVMRNNFLRRLELHGFKSFAAKTVLDFPARITAIVGPNGSGKSNIVDGLRWVLGERGAKELRGATFENLIFAGNPKKSQSSLAKITLYFNNDERSFPFDVEEVALVRRIDRSGASQFFWNDVETKLKDLLPILAKAKLGSRGMNLIGQGQSDMFVKCDPKERRMMIEEILGLKEFRLKKEQAEHRLESSSVNMEKVGAMLEELAPHLRFLRKQKNRFEKRAELEKMLTEIENGYFYAAQSELLRETENLEKPFQDLSGQEKEIRKDIGIFEKKLADFEKSIGGENVYREIRNTITEFISKRSIIEKELARLEVKIEFQKNSQNETRAPSEAIAFVENLLTEIKSAMDLNDLKKVKERLGEWLLKINKLLEPRGVDANADFSTEKKKYERELLEINKEIKKLDVKGENFAADQTKINQEFRRHVQNLELKKNELREIESKKQTKFFEKEKIELKIKELEHDWLAAGRNHEDFKELIKNSAFAVYKNNAVDRSETERKMFKMRAELAAIGEIDPTLAKEAEESEERFNFLSRELKDLETAVSDLKTLIKNLEENINANFKKAFSLINEEFNKYCRLMFGGGKAKLKIIKEKTDDAGDAENMAGVDPVRDHARARAPEGPLGRAVSNGVEIDLNLPGKKILSLDMLSGGEKSLVSLAALFALIAVSPPPFLVLDEIDAALDEENARRFAELVKDFSKKTQFIIVTHNRATMEAADILYGVTISEDGSSKILSLKFD